MSSPFVLMLSGSAKRACIDEKIINRQVIELQDTRKFVSTVRDDISGTHRSLPAMEMIGVLLVVTVIVTDVIMDTAGRAVEKEFPQFKAVNWVYEKARKYRNDNSHNKFKQELDGIEKAIGHVKKGLPKGTGGEAINMTLDTFLNLARNTTLLMTQIEDNAETRRSVVQSLKGIEGVLAKLDKQIANLQNWQSIGEGAGNIERMSRIPVAPSLP